MTHEGNWLIVMWRNWTYYQKTAFRIVIIYMAISVLWVLLSDWVLIYFFKSEVKWLQNAKGSFYILLSGFLYYYLIQKGIKAAIENQQQYWLIVENAETWAFSDTSIKLYPSCRYSHPFINSALVLRSHCRHDEIDQIVIGVNETANMLCQPLEDRCHPKTIQDAKFSIPFMVAFAFVHGSVHLNNLTERALMDTEVLDLSNRIKIEQTQADTPGIPLGDIKIVTAKGTKRHIERIQPETSFDEVKKKFIECCQYANVADPEVLWDTLSHNLDFDEVNRLPMIIQ